MKRLYAAILASLFASAPALAAQPSQFSVSVTGQGAPLVLIPGLASPAAVWDGTVDALCKRGPYQCHVLHLAGFAGKPAPAQPSLDTVKEELAAYIRARGLHKPVLIGHSLGGFLALRLAADEPALPGRVVVVDALPALGALQAPGVGAEQLREMAASRRQMMLQQTPEQFQQFSAMSIKTMVTKPEDGARIAGWGQQSDRVTVIQAMTDLLGTDLRQDLKRVTAPVLVLGSWIAYRDYTTREVVEATFREQYKYTSKLTLEMADTARHFIMFDDPDWMLARIQPFLKL